MAHLLHAAPDIPELGTLIEEIHEIKCQKAIQGFMKYPNNMLDAPRFPGAQPVSFSAEHIDLIRNNAYYVCEKTDGERRLLFITKGNKGQFMIDRKNQYRSCKIHFPLPVELIKDEVTVHHRTVLDGEYVVDRVRGKPGETQLTFLIYDILMINGIKTTEFSLPDRLKLIESLCLYPRHVAKAAGYDFSTDTIENIRLKEMYDAKHVAHVWDKVCKDLLHSNDGLIFTPIYRPYTFGTDEWLLKWKPKEMNTCDFKVVGKNSVIDKGYQLLAHMGDSFIDWFSLPEDLEAKYGIDSNIQSFMYSNTWNRENPPIIECSYDPHWRVTWMENKIWRSKIGGWVFMRIRSDKREGNHISTVKNVITSINQDLSINDIKAVYDPTHDFPKFKGSTPVDSEDNPQIDLFGPCNPEYVSTSLWSEKKPVEPRSSHRRER